MDLLAPVGATVSSLLALQAAQALLTAFVFWAFQQRFGNPVLASWTNGWVALVGQLAGLGGYAWLIGRGASPTGAALTAVVAFTLTCGYLQVAWLLLGAFALALQREMPARVLRSIMLGALVVAGVSCLPYATAGGAGASRFFARAGTLGIITGLARLVAGVALWMLSTRRVVGVDPTWPEPRHSPALGQRLVAAAFVALGGLTLVSLMRAIASPSPADVAPIMPPLTDGQLLLNFALGLGLVIWLLEVEQRRAMEAAHRAEHMAYHDPLTGLPNRLLLMDRLRLLVAQARRTRQPFAVFFLDVDHFKDINDSFGHAGGDRVLQQLAARLTAQLREADTVARLGGDEFVVLTPDLKRGGDVIAVGEKLLEAVRAPMSVDEHDIEITVSIGVSVFPDDGGDADALLRRSDSALYIAKADGRDGVRLA